ncbi:MAG: sensor histidine kinase [Gammaproteobacteria bacterium]|jgi:signal transduction histidine kinase|nr:sensor histidine kinase [Gammaproteobacteria bacterium]
MNSLAQRLNVGLGISLILLTGLIGWLIYDQNQRLADELIVSRLQHDGEGLLAALQVDAEGNATLLEGAISAIYQRPLSGHYFLLQLENGGSLRSRSLWDAELSGATLAPGEQHTRRITGPAEQPLLMWAGGYRKGNHNVTIMVAEDLSQLQQRLLQNALLLLALTVIFLFLILFIQRRIVRDSFAPLRQLGREIEQLERGDIDQLTEAVPLEVQPLVVEVNRLLLVMGRRLERSRNALGNLAHALKGPLNLLTQLADDKNTPAALQQELHRHTTALQQQIEHELNRARLAGAGSAGQRFNPAEELPALITVLERIYHDKKIKFDCKYPEQNLTNVDRHDLLELLGNLLDNATKWAKAKVNCSIEQSDAIYIVVEDDGNGVSEQELAVLTQRGYRLDESRPGHGLGLAIVKEIVELYNGTLELDRSPELDGLRVRLSLSPKR